MMKRIFILSCVAAFSVALIGCDMPWQGGQDGQPGEAAETDAEDEGEDEQGQDD